MHRSIKNFMIQGGGLRYHLPFGFKVHIHLQISQNGMEWAENLSTVALLQTRISPDQSTLKGKLFFSNNDAI
jgi:hypothetical protein